MRTKRSRWEKCEEYEFTDIVTETVKLLDVLQFAHGRHQNKGVHKGRVFVVRQVNHR